MIVTDSAASSARADQEQFLDLLCADEELLRAEFDAIVAAEWSVAPPAPPGPDGAGLIEPVPHRAPPRRRRRILPALREHRVGFSRWGRQRSPPPD